MKVLHCVPTFDVGGLGSFALELIRAWKAQFPGDKHVVQAALFPETKPLLRGAFHGLLTPINCVEVPRHLLNPEGYWDAVRVALTSHGRNGWDAVLIYNVFDLPWLFRGIRGAGYRGTLFIHVGTHIEQNERDMGPVTTSLPGARRFIFPCASVMRTTLAIPGFDPLTRGPVIYNGVDLSRFRRSNRSGARVLRYGFMGRMDDNVKDWTALIKAFARMGDADVSLILAGDGPHRAKYEKLALELRAPVTFTGALPPERIPAFLGNLDVFIMAALPVEGFSMALVEALATGLPIIATDTPSNQEAAEGAALYVKPGDPNSYRAAVLMMQEESHRAACAELSVARGKAFSIDVTVARYRETFLNGN
jgi:glycosyltransferase involved in cell wall biosynthesis